MIRQSTNDGLSVETVCEALDVSVSGYYAQREREASGHEQADEQLGQAIRRIVQSSHQTHGNHRVYQALQQDGVRTSLKQVARLMREYSLRSVRAVKRRIGLTQAGHPAFIVGFIQSTGGRMGEHHDARLATAALDMAVRRQRPGPALIVHSDRGNEFANARFHQRATRAKIRLSISSTGNCYDNAVAKKLSTTVKLEAVRGQIFASQAVARQELFDFIEVFSNRQRLHSGCHYAPPVSRVA